jgi:hypothetical protein
MRDLIKEFIKLIFVEWIKILFAALSVLFMIFSLQFLKILINPNEQQRKKENW